MKPIIGAFEGVDGDGFVELSRHYFAEEERFIQKEEASKEAAAALRSSADSKKLRNECKHILMR